MSLLSEAQRAVVAQIEEPKRAVEEALQRVTELLREIERRDNDTTGMNAETETGDDLLARAQAAYALRRAAVIAAANGLPTI